MTPRGSKAYRSGRVQSEGNSPLLGEASEPRSSTFLPAVHAMNWVQFIRPIQWAARRRTPRRR